MMEIHPAHRSAPSGLWEAAMSVIAGIATPAERRVLGGTASGSVGMALFVTHAQEPA
jgi:hypothetical protein